MSDREMDALVATRVMGITPRTGYRFEDGDQIFFDQRTRYLGQRRSPRYSTDPAACQQLKDKLRADGWSCMVTSYADKANRHGGRMFAAMFLRADRDLLGKGESNDSELMAVCIAALRASGVEVQEGGQPKTAGVTGEKP